MMKRGRKPPASQHAISKDNRVVVGVDDMVLLPDTREAGIVENLKIRLKNGDIYTFIGNVLVVCNPYKWLEIYEDEVMRQYVNKQRVDMPPHIFAIGEASYRGMIQEEENQCVIISGESGAGKTEASKQIQSYVAKVSGGGADVERIKDIFLQSNPVLEAFGNAKTLRNNNSSRFGKYFELKFDRFGFPVGGVVSNYLLEKNRICNPGKGERNFHIFYQLTASRYAPRLALAGGADAFAFLSCSGCTKVDGIDDATDFEETIAALRSVRMSNSQITRVLSLIAGILHLGNLKFVSTQVEGTEGSLLDRKQGADALQKCCELLQVDEAALERVLTFREMTTRAAGGRTDSYQIPQQTEQAGVRRDSIARALYERLFDLIVSRINVALDPKITLLKRIQDNGADNPAVEDVDAAIMALEGELQSIGVLDIYGFEVFEKNGFDQLCINYVNEKLQQIFIELTLRAEQDQYAQEGIAWTPIPFFNNKIVCDLLDGAPNKPVMGAPPGLFRILDDTTRSMHGTKDPLSLDRKFLETAVQVHCSSSHATRAYFSKFKEGFVIKHYAGEVTYRLGALAEANKDALSGDLLTFLQQSRDKLVQHMFPAEKEEVEEELSERGGRVGNGRRDTPGSGSGTGSGGTAGQRIRSQCDKLVSSLMECTPHYVRCVKSNDTKSPLSVDPARVTHQVRYLGLRENIHVRRAGFAYRADCFRFFDRFALLLLYSPVSRLTAEQIGRLSDRNGCKLILSAVVKEDERQQQLMQERGNLGSLGVNLGGDTEREQDGSGGGVEAEDAVNAELAELSNYELIIKSLGGQRISTLLRNKDEMQLGKSMLFIRKPEVYFALEKLRELKLCEFAGKIQRAFRSYNSRRVFVHLSLRMAKLYMEFDKSRRRDSVCRPFLGDVTANFAAQMGPSLPTDTGGEETPESGTKSTKTGDINNSSSGLQNIEKEKLLREDILRIIDFYDSSETVLFSDTCTTFQLINDRCVGGFAHLKLPPKLKTIGTAGSSSTSSSSSATTGSCLYPILLVLTSAAVYLMERIENVSDWQAELARQSIKTAKPLPPSGLILRRRIPLVEWVDRRLHTLQDQQQQQQKQQQQQLLQQAQDVENSNTLSAASTISRLSELLIANAGGCVQGIHISKTADNFVVLKCGISAVTSPSGRSTAAASAAASSSSAVSPTKNGRKSVVSSGDLPMIRHEYPLKSPIVTHLKDLSSGKHCAVTGRAFSVLFNWRHHCRLTGNVCGTKNCDFKSVIPDLGHYSTPQRVCDTAIGLAGVDPLEDVVLLVQRKTEFIALLALEMQKAKLRVRSNIVSSDEQAETTDQGENAQIKHFLRQVTINNEISLSKNICGMPTRLPADLLVFSASSSVRETEVSHERLQILRAGKCKDLESIVELERSIEGGKSVLKVSAPVGMSQEEVKERRLRQMRRQKASARRRRLLAQERQERFREREQERELQRIQRVAERKARKKAAKEAAMGIRSSTPSSSSSSSHSTPAMAAGAAPMIRRNSANSITIPSTGASSSSSSSSSNSVAQTGRNPVPRPPFPPQSGPVSRSASSYIDNNNSSSSSSNKYSSNSGGSSSPPRSAARSSPSPPPPPPSPAGRAAPPALSILQRSAALFPGSISKKTSGGNGGGNIGGCGGGRSGSIISSSGSGAGGAVKKLKGVEKGNSALQAMLNKRATGELRPPPAAGGR